VVSQNTENILTVQLIQELQKRGRKIALFGEQLDHSSVQKKYLEYGVDFLLSDRPDILRKTVDQIQNSKNVVK